MDDALFGLGSPRPSRVCSSGARRMALFSSDSAVPSAGLANGFFWEFWNHGSNVFVPGRNPNFWVYKIPYVNVIHVFSEMPLLGYFGYLPFGAQCWVWWLVAAHLLKFSPDFDPEHVGLPGATRLPSTPPPPGPRLPVGVISPVA